MITFIITRLERLKVKRSPFCNEGQGIHATGLSQSKRMAFQIIPSLIRIFLISRGITSMIFLKWNKMALSRGILKED